MVTNKIIFFATSVQPNPEEIDYWVDLSDNPYGGSIKYFNGTEWVRLAASGGTPDLSNSSASESERTIHCPEPADQSQAPYSHG